VAGASSDPERHFESCETESILRVIIYLVLAAISVLTALITFLNQSAQYTMVSDEQPTDDAEEDKTPLKCYTGTGDGFSGWYAISDPRVCNDFCFWRLEDNDVDEYEYNASNTADPHQITRTPSSKWVCVLNVGQSKDVTWDNLWDSSVSEFSSPEKFQYLRCNRDAAQQLSTIPDAMATSSVFWCLILTISMAFMLWEGCWLIKRKRQQQDHRNREEVAEVEDVEINLTESRRLVSPLDESGDAVETETRYASPGVDETRETNVELPHVQSGQDDSPTGETVSNETESIEHEGPRRRPQPEPQQNGISKLLFGPPWPCFHSRVVVDDVDGGSATNDDPQLRASATSTFCSPLWLFYASCGEFLSNRRVWKKCGIVFGLVVGNIILLALLIISTISLTEIVGKKYYAGNTMFLTPACSNPSNRCPAYANHDIHHASMPPAGNKETSTTPPFSYLIASDAQLDWFNGEFAYLGQHNYPPPCGESDSCGACTEKFGRYSNAQMKIAFARIMNKGKSHDESPAPDTLVMNGDLTAYFHPKQKRDYDAIYHTNIEGLEHYFPSLGNHDYDHGGGGSFNADQWWGPPSCNSAHAIAYMKSGLCGDIPKFHPERLVRYHAESLAYSWEEGRYHFVHLHYFSSFENARHQLASSMQWLEQDLSLAHQANRTSVVFIHAAQGLNPAMEPIFANKGVAAIFAGHTHRCLCRKCVGLVALAVNQVNESNATALQLSAEKCAPGTMGPCGGNVIGKVMALFYLKHKQESLVLPNNTKLFFDAGDGGDADCPKPTPAYINETDNTLLCRKGVFHSSDFVITDPSQGKQAANTSKEESIPIFWSGSASFETFLKADFYHNRIVVNAMTAMEGVEGERYVNVHSLPNAVYPYHNASDLDEITIFI
jgi:hypothetical protein